MRTKRVIPVYTAFIILAATVVLFSRPAEMEKIQHDERVVLYREYAILSGDRVHVRVHGQVYEPEHDSSLRNEVIEELQEMMDLEPGTHEFSMFQNRVRPFLRDHERGKEITVQCGEVKETLQLSGADGHFSGVLRLNHAEINMQDVNAVVEYRVANPGVDESHRTGRSVVVPPRGISVISDIDDTIKRSNVLDKKELLRNTFTRRFKDVPGMAPLYAGWAGKGAAFHYVSGSPWQLYGPLSHFLDEKGFPFGSMHLKKFRITDTSGIRFVVGDQLEYKLSVIQAIIDDFPGRQFILVGDSGEQDPEVYTRVTVANPGKIRAILVRDAGNLQSSGRIEALKKKTGNTRWVIFKKGNDIPRGIVR